MAKSPEHESVSGNKTRTIKVKVFAKAYINRRLYEVGETAQITWPVDEDLPKHLREVKEKKED